MRDEKPIDHRVLLVVGQDPGLRMQISEAVESLKPGAQRVHSLSPDKLGDPSPWIDANAAIVVVGGETSGADLEPLSKLRETACASRILLVVDRALDSIEAQALIAALHPLVVLDSFPSSISLSSALDLLFPPSIGESARPQHRSASGLLGVSRAIRDLTEEIRQIAPSRIPVLILGETGTGKEVVARAIHEESDRSGAPFVAINCGAFPETLLESELFGSEKGAFTGANRDRKGVFEQADKGTLFLDEIGEMAPAMQVKLLRVLEDGQIRRVGGTSSIVVDVRIVSATHRDLETATAEGDFRQDLLFRLNTASLHLPPLRRRAVDIPFLAQHFAEEFGLQNARRITLSEDFIEALCEHDFPGNVRELRNAVERAIALAQPDAHVSRRHLPSGMMTSPPWQTEGTLKEKIEHLESHVIRETLDRFDGNRTRSAEALGISRVGLRQKLRRLGLD